MIIRIILFIALLFLFEFYLFIWSCHMNGAPKKLTHYGIRSKENTELCKQGSRCTSGTFLSAHKCQQSRTDILNFWPGYDLYAFYFVDYFTQCLRKSLNSVETLVRHFKYLLASNPLIIRHSHHFSFIWVIVNHCHIFIFHLIHFSEEPTNYN